MNRFAWDFRTDGPAQIPGAFYVGEPPRGPLVMPGTYQVKLTVKGKTQTASLEIVNDPRLKNIVSRSRPAEAGRAAAKVQKDIDNLHRAVNQIRGLRANLQTCRNGPARHAEQRSHRRRQRARLRR